MRKTTLLLLLALTSVALQAQSFAAYKTMFWNQMASTCAPNLRWEKSVKEIAEDGQETTETKIFDLDCIVGLAKDATTTIPMNPAEFGHVFEYAYDNPYVSPYMDVTATPTSIDAKVKAGEEGKSKLRMQHFQTDPNTGRLLVAEASIIKGSALYDFEVHISVIFDAAGHYQSHIVETKTDVLLGGTVHTMIKARLL